MVLGGQPPGLEQGECEQDQPGGPAPPSPLLYDLGDLRAEVPSLGCWEGNSGSLVVARI